MVRRVPRRTIGSAFAERLLAKDETVGRTNPDEPPVKTRTVPCSRHEERELGPTPCVLSASLEGDFAPNAVLRIHSKREPDLHFYARAHPGNFAQSVAGISILRSIAESARIMDKEVELSEVNEGEAELNQAVIVVSDRYFSKRDIWHMHLAMMQHGGQLLYLSFKHNLRQQCPNSRIEKLSAGCEQRPVFCGLVTPKTELSFKSDCAEMFVLLQVSSELWSFGLSGRPYWDILLECFTHLVEKSLRVSGEGCGHYIRMLLFTRAKCSEEHHASDLHPSEPAPDHEDFYEVFWEGYSKAMPPVQKLVAHVREFLSSFHEQSRACCQKYGTASGTLDGIRARDVVEASRGNVFECLNMVLDHFDFHHLDRNLRVTGQQIVLLTAGNGLFHTASQEIYDLTHHRFTAFSPSSFNVLQMICVRQPPLHRVPWVHWPGGLTPPAEGDLSLPALPLPVSPNWMEIAFFPEVILCTCPPKAENIKSVFLPLELLQKPLEHIHVPRWSDEQCGITRLHELRDTTLHRQISSRVGVYKPCFVNSSLWDNLRVPRLSPYFTNKPEPEGLVGREPPISISPNRFPENDAEAEKREFMMDLIGLRLESLQNSQLYRPKVSDSFLEVGISKERKPINDTWVAQGRLIPSTLHSLSVRAKNGLQWKFEPRQVGLAVFHERRREKDNNVTKHTFCYSGYYVRRRLVQRECPDAREEEHSELVGENRFWIPSKRVFHLPMPLEWNNLDTILAGDLPMPAALPYPVEVSSKVEDDRCPRNAVKLQLFILVPREDSMRSQMDHFAGAMKHLDGKIELGTDPFEVSGEFVREDYRLVREQSFGKFKDLRSGIEELCFSKASQKDNLKLDISVDENHESFAVKRRNSTIYVKNMPIPSSFPNSRDWFELFYDSAYAPPKLFHLVLQWIVCSSVHLYHFVTQLASLAEEHGFSLVRMPIAQLFPPPTPHWVWGHDRETNFDRLALNPRRAIDLPSTLDEKGWWHLYANLLESFLKPPLNLLFVFSSATDDFEVRNLNDGRGTQARQRIYQRMKGWVMCDREGRCLVALRERTIYWYESRLAYQSRDSRTHDRTLQNIDRLRSVFFSIVESIIAECCTSQQITDSKLFVHVP